MNIPDFVRSRLDPWYSTPPKEGAQSTLFTVCEKMVADAVAEKDKEIAALKQARDDAVEAARIGAEKEIRLRRALEMAESWGEAGIETMDGAALEEYDFLKS